MGSLFFENLLGLIWNFCSNPILCASQSHVANSLRWTNFWTMAWNFWTMAWNRLTQKAQKSPCNLSLGCQCWRVRVNFFCLNLYGSLAQNRSGCRAVFLKCRILLWHSWVCWGISPSGCRSRKKFLYWKLCGNCGWRGVGSSRCPVFCRNCWWTCPFFGLRCRWFRNRCRGCWSAGRIWNFSWTQDFAH